MFGLITLLVAMLAAQTQAPAARPAEHAHPDLQTLVKLEREWMDALVRKDHKALEAFLAPSYALTTSDAPMLNIDRSAWLKNVATYNLHSFTQREHRVRNVSQNVVAVSLIHTQKATVNGRDRSGEFFIVDLWEKKGPRWQVLARFSSPLGSAGWQDASRPAPKQ